MDEFTASSSEENQIDISDNVIATMALRTALAVKGIHSVSTRFYDDVVGGISGRLGQKTSIRGVTIKHKKGIMEVNLYLNVIYGNQVRDVARTVQQNIRTALETMLDITGARINVNIEGLISGDPEGQESQHESEQKS